MPKFHGYTVSKFAKFAILDEAKMVAHGPFDTEEEVETFIHKRGMWPHPRVICPMGDYQDKNGNINGFTWAE